MKLDIKIPSTEEKSVIRCNQCLIQNGIYLLHDFFPVGKEYASKNNNVSKVEISENNLCQYCTTYNKNFDRDHIRKELLRFVSSSQKGNYDAIVALSGGKDSICALFLSSFVLKMKIIAFIYDNGFIPDKVISQSRSICSELNVPLVIVKKDLYKEFVEEYEPDENGVWNAKTGLDFCHVCSNQISNTIQQLVKEYNVYKVIFGNKIYTELSPKVSCIKNSLLNIEGDYKIITCINLLFALDIKKSNQEKILKEVKWESPKLEGYTSNCLIPGFVDFARRKKINAPSDAGYIEMELRSGMYTIEEAKELLNNNIQNDPSDKISRFMKDANIQI